MSGTIATTTNSSFIPTLEMLLMNRRISSTTQAMVDHLLTYVEHNSSNIKSFKRVCDSQFAKKLRKDSKKTGKKLKEWVKQTYIKALQILQE